jgi:hypothetical protein
VHVEPARDPKGFGDSFVSVPLCLVEDEAELASGRPAKEVPPKQGDQDRRERPGRRLSHRARLPGDHGDPSLGLHIIEAPTRVGIAEQATEGLGTRYLGE